MHTLFVWLGMGLHGMVALFAAVIVSGICAWGISEFFTKAAWIESFIYLVIGVPLFGYLLVTGPISLRSIPTAKGEVRDGSWYVRKRGNR